MAIETGFIPAVNKEGLGRLTFLGLQKLEGKEGEISKRTKKAYDKDWAITELVFEALGRVRGTTQTIKVSVREKYEEGEALAIALNNMGYVAPTIETEETDDGFEVEALPENDEGFGVEEADYNALAVTDFLAANVGSVFVGKVYKETSDGKKRWTISLETLKPLVKSTAK